MKSNSDFSVTSIVLLLIEWTYFYVELTIWAFFNMLDHLKMKEL